jgi:DNA-binding CsgD family transcriptional regulator
MTWALRFLVIFQAGFTAVFLWDLAASILGLRSTPISWQMREVIEVGAALGLLAGLIAGTLVLRHARSRQRLAEDNLRAASGEFMAVVNDRFADWALTPAERDVALFALKGLSLAEIADLRDTSEGTVKAQTNAIYRKAGVTGRPQLLSLFIDDLLAAEPGQIAAQRRIEKDDAVLQIEHEAQ